MIGLPVPPDGRRVRAFALLVLSASVLFLIVTSCATPAPGVHESGESSTSANDAHGSTHQAESNLLRLSDEMLVSMELRVGTVTRRALPLQFETTGRVDFEQNLLAHVTPRIPGRVESVSADLGDEVHAGDVLAIIDSIELGQSKAAYLEARAEERVARRDFEREQELFSESISSEKQLLAAEAAHLETVARLRSAEETLRLYGVDREQIEALSFDGAPQSLLSVRAPLAGRVVEKHVTIGELVTPERNLFTVANLSKVWVWIDVFERDLGRVHLDDDVRVAVDSYPDAHFVGRVSYISDQVDMDTRTVRARIDVANENRQLRPGMFASVAVTDPHSAPPDALPLVVPAAAVQRIGDEFTVFVVREPGVFEPRDVAVGRRVQDLFEVLSGLDVGEEVVTQGAFLLKSEASKGHMGSGHAH